MNSFIFLCSCLYRLNALAALLLCKLEVCFLVELIRIISYKSKFHSFILFNNQMFASNFILGIILVVMKFCLYLIENIYSFAYSTPHRIKHIITLFPVTVQLPKCHSNTLSSLKYIYIYIHIFM